MIVIPRTDGASATDPVCESSRSCQEARGRDHRIAERPPDVQLDQASTGRSSHTPKHDYVTGQEDEQLMHQTRESQSLASSSRRSQSLASPSHDSRSLASPSGENYALHPARVGCKSSSNTTKRRMPTPSSFPSESSFPPSLLSQDARSASVGTSTVDSSSHLSPRTPGLPFGESPPSMNKTSPRQRSRRVRATPRPWAHETEGSNSMLSTSVGLPAPPPSNSLPPVPGASREPVPWDSPTSPRERDTAPPYSGETRAWAPEANDRSDADAPSLPSLGTKLQQADNPVLATSGGGTVTDVVTDPLDGVEQEELDDANPLGSFPLPVTGDHLLRPTHSSSRLSTVSEAETCATAGTGVTAGTPQHLRVVPLSSSSSSTSPAQTAQDSHVKPSPRPHLPASFQSPRPPLPFASQESIGYASWHPSHPSQSRFLRSLRAQGELPGTFDREAALVTPDAFSPHVPREAGQRLHRSPSLSAADYARPDIRPSRPLARPNSAADLRLSAMTGRRRLYSLSDLPPDAMGPDLGGSMRHPLRDGERQAPREFGTFPQSSAMSPSGHALGASRQLPPGVRAAAQQRRRPLRSMPSAPALSMARSRADSRDSPSWSDMQLRRPASTIFDHHGSSGVEPSTRPSSTMFPSGARPAYLGLSTMGFSPIPSCVSGSMTGMTSTECGEDPFSSSRQWVDPELFAMRPGRRRANSAAQDRFPDPQDGSGDAPSETAHPAAVARTRARASTNNLRLSEPVLQDARQRFEPVLGSGPALDLLTGASLQALSAQHKQQPLTPLELSLWASNFLAEYSYATEHAGEHPPAATPDEYRYMTSSAQLMQQSRYHAQQTGSYDPPPHPPPNMALPAGPGGYPAPNTVEGPMYDDDNEAYSGHPASTAMAAPSQWGRDPVHSPLPAHEFLAHEVGTTLRPRTSRPLSGYTSDTPLPRTRSTSHLSSATGTPSVPTVRASAGGGLPLPSTASGSAASGSAASEQRRLIGISNGPARTTSKRSLRSFASAERLRALTRAGHTRGGGPATSDAGSGGGAATAACVASPFPSPLSSPPDGKRPAPVPPECVPAPGGADPQMDMLPFEVIAAPRKKGFLSSLFRRSAKRAESQRAG